MCNRTSEVRAGARPGMTEPDCFAALTMTILDSSLLAALPVILSHQQLWIDPTMTIPHFLSLCWPWSWWRRWALDITGLSTAPVPRKRKRKQRPCHRCEIHQCLFSDLVRVTGFIVPRREAVVGVDQEGSKVSDLLVREGEMVADNQELARLTPPPQQPGAPAAGGRAAPTSLRAPAAGLITEVRTIAGAPASPQAGPMFEFRSTTRSSSMPKCPRSK